MRKSWVVTLLSCVGLIRGIQFGTECTIDLISPHDSDTIGVAAVRAKGTIQLQSATTSFPFVACAVVETARTSAIVVHCFDEMYQPSTALNNEIAIDARFATPDGDGEYGLAVFGMFQTTKSQAEAAVKLFLGGDSPNAVKCGASVKFYLVTSFTQPWWLEYLAPGEVSQRQLTEVMDKVKEARQNLLTTATERARASHMLDTRGWLNLFQSPPPLSLRGIPHLLGPVPTPHTVSEDIRAQLSPVVVIFSGGANKWQVHRNVQRLIRSCRDANVPLSIVLCVYDNSDWNDVFWVAEDVEGVSVIVVKARKQMRLWWVAVPLVHHCVLSVPLCRYVKRFLTPLVAHTGSYSHVIILDADVDIPTQVFDVVRLWMSTPCVCTADSLHPRPSGGFPEYDEDVRRHDRTAFPRSRLASHSPLPLPTRGRDSSGGDPTGDGEAWG